MNVSLLTHFVSALQASHNRGYSLVPASGDPEGKSLPEATYAVRAQ